MTHLSSPLNDHLCDHRLLTQPTLLVLTLRLVIRTPRLFRFGAIDEIDL
jgi:hypothetical protein